MRDPRTMPVFVTGIVLFCCGTNLRADDGEDIHSAAQKGDTELVAALLANSPELALSRNQFGQTPLHLSALGGTNSANARSKRTQVTSLLLRNGAEVDATDQRDMTPLHLAAIKGRTGMVDLLIAARADVQAKDDLGRTPLHYAASGNHLMIIERLLAEGAQVNATDSLRETPLHMAAWRFRKEAAQLLIAKGAEVDVRNADGATPLNLATAQGPEAKEVDLLLTMVVEVLLANGAEVNAKDNNGASPLRHAIDRGHQKLVELLRRAGGIETAKGGHRTAKTFEYHTYAQIGRIVQDAELNYPDICKWYILGNSVEGRNLWALRISDNVPQEEDEPEFKYIAAMHGDEWTGMEMCLYLIEHLTSNYGIDPRITNIVDEIDLWIVPLMNPDGFDRPSPIRYNANGVDLNRNFPDPYTSPNNTTAGREPETAVIMDWGFGQSFTLSANMHGGALVANYPFDTNAAGASVYTATPDDALFIYISEEYSRYNLPMWNSPVFYHGITNGADWYSINGGMQDWNYIYMGDNEITLELSNIKIPPASQMPQFWNENRESLLAYMETSLIGVRGLVTDAGTGAPLLATVTVIGRNHEIYSDPDIGDYHRMLLPGTYDLKFESANYDQVVVPNVVVNSGAATRLDIGLEAPPEVTSPNGGETLLSGVPTTVTWTGSSTAQFHVQYTSDADETVLISDGFEDGSLSPEYTTGGDALWYVTSSSAHTGTYSARAGNISHNQVSWMTRSADSGPLSFWYRVSSEYNWDFFSFYIDGQMEIHQSGNVGWTYYSTTLPSGTHELKWEYAKDQNTSSGSDTVWIDDLQLTQDITVWNDIIALTNVGETSTPWTPLIEGTDYKVRVRAFYSFGSYGLWDESDSSFTVAPDCNGNGISDYQDLADCQGETWCSDCNTNGILDECDISSGSSVDCQPNGIPDECEGGPWYFGDVNDDGGVDLTDLLCMLDGMSGLFICPGVIFQDLDIIPCGSGDYDINLYDLFAILDALAGNPGCPDPCY